MFGKLLASVSFYSCSQNVPLQDFRWFVLISLFAKILSVLCQNLIPSNGFQMVCVDFLTYLAARVSFYPEFSRLDIPLKDFSGFLLIFSAAWWLVWVFYPESVFSAVWMVSVSF